MVEEFDQDLKRGRTEDDLAVAAMDIMKQLDGRCYDYKVKIEVYEEFLKLLLLIGKSNLIAKFLEVMAKQRSYLCKL